MRSGSGNADAFSNIVDRRRAVMLLIILVYELQYPVQSFLILCSHISTSVSIWDFKSHNVIILRQKRNAIGLQKGKTRWRFCSSPHIIVFSLSIHACPDSGCSSFGLPWDDSYERKGDTGRYRLRFMLKFLRTALTL